MEELRQLAPVYLESSQLNQSEAVQRCAVAEADQMAREHSNQAQTTSGVHGISSSSSSVFTRVQQVFTDLDQDVAQAAGNPCHLEAVLGKLDAMIAAPVTAAMLKDQGWGLKLKALSKGGQKEIAVAAKSVITAWKQTICKEL